MKTSVTEIVQRFRHIVARHERVEIEDGLALPLNFRCADDGSGGLFATQQAVTAEPTAKRGLAKTMGVTENCGVCEYALFTDFDRKIDEVGREKAVLRSGFVEISA